MLVRQRNGENRPARIFKSSRRVVQIKYLGCRILDLPVLASSQLELISDKTTGTQLQQNALKPSSCVSKSSRQFNLFSAAGVECGAKVWLSGHTVDHTSSGRDRSTGTRTANEVPNQHLKTMDEAPFLVSCRRQISSGILTSCSYVVSTPCTRDEMNLSG